MEMLGEKVKCKLCGKIGLAKDKKGLRMHYRIAHNEILSKKANLLDYFGPASQDEVVDVISPSQKQLLKEKSRKWKKASNGLTVLKNAFTRIIYTPMGNKR